MLLQAKAHGTPKAVHRQLPERSRFHRRRPRRRRRRRRRRHRRHRGLNLPGQLAQPTGRPPGAPLCLGYPAPRQTWLPGAPLISDAPARRVSQAKRRRLDVSAALTGGRGGTRGHRGRTCGSGGSGSHGFVNLGAGAAVVGGGVSGRRPLAHGLGLVYSPQLPSPLWTPRKGLVLEVAPTMMVGVDLFVGQKRNRDRFVGKSKGSQILRWKLMAGEGTLSGVPTLCKSFSSARSDYNTSRVLTIDRLPFSFLAEARRTRDGS